jgi:hypothetical protein
MACTAVISSKNSTEVFKTEPRVEEKDFVQGALVIGLTEANMRSLDYFEGNVSVFPIFDPRPHHYSGPPQMYRRENIETHKLAELMSFVGVDVKVLTASIDRLPENLSEKVDAVTYVWANDMDELKKEAWSFDEFVVTKLSRWM